MIRLLVLALMSASPALVGAQHAHEHGIARLQVALDGGKLVIILESPLDNLVGFEHAPRNEKQRGALAKTTEDLAAPERLFKLSAAADCKLVRAESAHPHQGTGQRPAGMERNRDEVHAELQGSWEFACAKPESLSRIDVQLFDVFRGIKRIKAQVATGKGQSAADLTTGKRTLTW